MNEAEARQERLAKVAERMEVRRAGLLTRTVDWLHELGVLDPLNLEETQLTGQEEADGTNPHAPR